ncbi:MAG: glucose-6-phosphate dehydrogenase assembly protein OpcA [Dehalococcoidia bacterium]|nr:glucose-6-phosphate dehydrogenase assembly protein OpcA [Dehalococcoidia bacterium]
MAPDVAGIERLEDHEIAVDPPAIEAEFRRIWRDTSGGEDASSIRLRVLNFVAFAHERADIERFERVVRLLPQRHPCRAILALAGPEQETLRAAIAVLCWRPAAGAAHICAEEVRLFGGAGEQQEVASAVLGLLVPELPVVVWLMDRPELGGRMSGELIDTADRLIFDSAGQADGVGTFDRVLRAGQRWELALSDLAWGRLASWRALIAQFFDGEGVKQLSQIQSIEIASGGGSLSSEALLLAGWLVSRLGLSLADLNTSAERIEATLYDRTRGVTLTVARDDDAGAAPLREVRIRTSEATLGVEVHAESAHMHVREQWDDAPARRTVASLPGDDASVIAMALDDYADPAIYAEALGSALALLASPVAGS